MEKDKKVDDKKVDGNPKNTAQQEYYSVVVWKDLDGNAHIVGSLAYFERKILF